jgi:CheY-like chemotaxis protein
MDVQENTKDPGRLRILLVEDNTTIAWSLAEWLKQVGLEVEIAGDGLLALKAVEKQPADVVLLDLGLPGLDGYEVARRIRAMQLPRRPLLIAITGLVNEADRLRSYEVGIDLHLSKPVAAEEVLYFVERFRAASLPQAR